MAVDHTDSIVCGCAAVHGEHASHIQQQCRRDLADIMVHMPWLRAACDAQPARAWVHPKAQRAAAACTATAPKDIVTPRATARASHFNPQMHPSHSLANLQAIYASCGPVSTTAPRAAHAAPQTRSRPQKNLTHDATSGHDMWFAEQVVELSGLLNSEPSEPRVPVPVPASPELDAQSCMDGHGSVTAGGAVPGLWGGSGAAAASAAAVNAAAFADRTQCGAARSLEEGSGESDPVCSDSPNAYHLGSFPPPRRAFSHDLSAVPTALRAIA